MMEECGDSSDDENYPLLGEWRDKGFGNPVIQNIRGNEYEYRENEVVQGAKYPSIEAVKDAVKLWAISLRKEFRVVKSSSKEYEVKCVNGEYMPTRASTRHTGSVQLLHHIHID